MNDKQYQDLVLKTELSLIIQLEQNIKIMQELGVHYDFNILLEEYKNKKITALRQK